MKLNKCLDFGSYERNFVVMFSLMNQNNFCSLISMQIPKMMIFFTSDNPSINNKNVTYLHKINYFCIKVCCLNNIYLGRLNIEATYSGFICEPIGEVCDDRRNSFLFATGHVCQLTWALAGITFHRAHVEKNIYLYFLVS